MDGGADAVVPYPDGMAKKTDLLARLRKALMDARDLGEHRPMQELQREFGVSRRTLVRYLNELRASGDRLKVVRGKGWTMVKPRRDGSLESQIPELLLVVLRKVGSALRGTPWHEEFEALFGAELKRMKAAARLGRRGGAAAEAVRMNEVVFIADFAPGVRADGSVDAVSEGIGCLDDDGEPIRGEDFLQALRVVAWNPTVASIWREALAAARECRPVRVDYLNSSRGILNEGLVVLPLGVVLRPGGAYLVVHKVGSEERRGPVNDAEAAFDYSADMRRKFVQRTLAMQRIRKLRRMPGSFEVPKEFNLIRLVQDSVGGFIENGPLQTVLLEYAKDSQSLGSTEEWHPSQRVAMTGDGKALRIEFRTNSEIEVIRRVLALGGKVKLLKPKAWRDKVAHQAGALRAIHRDGSAVTGRT